MLGINAGPALSNCKIRSTQELPRGAQDELVYFFFVEDIDGQAVFVGVAECECSVGSLRNQGVNSPAVVLRCLLRDAPAKHWERSANLECGIETQGKPCCERRAELPSIGLRR